MKKYESIITHPEKILWPVEKYTKKDLLEYYGKVSKYILPHLKNRPLSLNRMPNGINKPGFYQKDAGNSAPDWIKRADIYAESSNKTVHYLVANDLRSLLYVANLGSIEMNPWNSTVNSLDKPDYFVMDIDPSDKNTFDQVVEVALVIKEILDRAGVDGYCKTSGSTGLHIYVPCKKKYDYEHVRDFARLIAEMTVEALSDSTTLERSLKKRKKSQIYVDYLQNSRGQTLASAYSVRPKPGATVSTPLEWKEVKRGLDLKKFTIKTIHARLEKKGDLFAPVLGKGLNMAAALKRLGA